MINDTQKESIRSSWRLVVPIADTAADLFYRRLFEIRPQYRGLFPDDMTQQKRKLIHMLAFIVKSLSWSDAQWRDVVSPDEDLLLVVLALGRRHRELYKIPDESYDAVGEALLWTLDYGLGEAFTPEVKQAWGHVYGLLASAMRMATATKVSDAPPPVTDAPIRLGEEALVTDLSKAGIDEAKMDFAEDFS